MQLKIHDEAERRAVLFALWRRAAAEIGERFHDELHREAEAALSSSPDDVAGILVTRDVTLLAAILLSVEEVREAPVGATVGLSMSADALRDALEQCTATISEDEAFWSATRASRERMLANHDAAIRVASRLLTAEAVAA
jgi:hypothetical protein